jgi:hypothetical protein
MPSKQLIFLIFLLQIALLGCSSGGSSADKTVAERPDLAGFTVEEISSAPAPTAKAMTKQDASVLAMQLLRLYSWEGQVSSTNHDGSNHYAFLTNNTPPGVPVGEVICYGEVSQKLRPAPQDFKAVTYERCLMPEVEGEKMYFDGEVAFKYVKERDAPGGILEVHYENLFTQFGEDQRRQYGKSRAARFNGQFQVLSDAVTWTFSANLTMQDNIIGEVTFNNVLIKRNALGQILEASGDIRVSRHGIFQISEEDGNLVIGSPSESHAKIRLEQGRGAFVEFYPVEGEAVGQYIYYDFLDEYDSRKISPPLQAIVPHDLARTGINNENFNISDDKFYLQGEEILVSLPQFYRSYDEDLLDYSLELVAIETTARIFGDKDAFRDLRISIDAIPEISRPILSISEVAPGKFVLVAERVPGKKVALVLRPTVEAEGGKVNQPSTFKVFLIGDFDKDGIFDNVDNDDDNDGVANELDDLPYDFASSRDTDFDGVGDFIDEDNDNDGIADEADEAPLDRLCHLPYSAFEGVCFNPLNRFDLVGPTPNGIALLRQMPGDPVFFRYDILNGEFYPPVFLDQLGGYYWTVSTNTKGNRLYFYTGGGAILTAMNTPDEVELRPVAGDLGGIDMQVSAIMEVGDYIYVEGGRDPFYGLRRSYLYSADGNELASVELEDDGYVSRCFRELLAGLSCDSFDGIFLPDADVAIAASYTPQGIRRSPDLKYYAYSLQAFDANHNIVHTFDNVIGWTSEGLIAIENGRVGVWDIENSRFIKSANYDQFSAHLFLLLGDELYAMQWALEQQFRAQKIHMDDMPR